MGDEKKCPFYRKPENLSFGKGIGYCDIDSISTTCEGDTKFCEKPDALKLYLQKKLEEQDNKKTDACFVKQQIPL